MKPTFKNFIVEQNEKMTAAAETSNMPREKRLQQARMSDSALRRQKEQELKDLKKSKDPIDREISTLRARLANLLKRKQQMKK